MRIVETDNFDGDYPDEKFFLWEMSPDAAEEIANAMNKHFCDRRYWKIVENDYELVPGFEP